MPRSWFDPRRSWPYPLTVLLLLVTAACGDSPTDTGSAALAVRATVPSAADGGDTLVVTITTDNTGDAVATGLTITFSAPAESELVSASNGGTIAGDSITWTAAELEAGASLEYQAALVTPYVGPFGTLARAEGSGTDTALVAGHAYETVVTAAALRTMDGHITGEQFGWEIEAIGDVDGDGAADMAVSAPFGSSGAGAIYIHSGADGSLIRQFDGQPNDWFGIDMNADGDFNGDGMPDLVVGAPGADGAASPGRVYIFSLADGSTIQTLTGEVNGDKFGWSAAPAGDVDGDGIPDLYVGARDSDVSGPDSGEAYIYSGADWSLLWDIDGPSQADRFGHAGAGVGDLDGDGLDDFAVGAPDWGDLPQAGRGKVFVYSGATGQELFPAIDPDATAISLGEFWVFTAGDMNGDGVPDIVAADINNAAKGTDTGRLYVYSGVDGSSILTLTGEAAGDQFGIAHPAGDLDGDGVMDLVIAAWLDSEGASQAGKVYLVSGATGETFRTITSRTANENFGFDAYVIGDVTGDGIPDLAVSGGISGSTTGYVKVFAGVIP